MSIDIDRRHLFRAATAAALAAWAALPGAAQELEKITFVQPSPSAINSFPVFVAIGEGYFAEEGLEVSVEAINGSGPVLQALSSGQAQFGRPGPGPVLAARGRGVDVVFIYNVAARSNFGLVVEEESRGPGARRPQGSGDRHRHRGRRRGRVRPQRADGRRA